MNLLNQISIRNNSLRSNDLEKENIIMKKSYEFDEKVILKIKETWPTIATTVSTPDFSFSKNGDFNSVQKYLNELNKRFDYSFKRKSNNWDCIIDFFKSDIDKSKDELSKYMIENLDMNEVQVKKYISSYFYIISEIYKINNS